MGCCPDGSRFSSKRRFRRLMRQENSNDANASSDLAMSTLATGLTKRSGCSGSYHRWVQMLSPFFSFQIFPFPLLCTFPIAGWIAGESTISRVCGFPKIAASLRSKNSPDLFKQQPPIFFPYTDSFFPSFFFFLNLFSIPHSVPLSSHGNGRNNSHSPPFISLFLIFFQSPLP